MFTIKNNISIPPAPCGQKNKYPFHEMEVGDCFEYPLELTKKIQASTALHGLRYNKKFVTRKIDHNLGCVWRIK